MSIENLQGEIWKIIDHPSIGCFDNYSVSNYGRVLSKAGNKEKILKGSMDKDGYLSIQLKTKRLRIHRLVGLMFLETPNTDPNNLQINHIDENKSNNCVSNLEWCTAKENINYGTCLERGATKRSKQVFQYTISGELVNTYPSATKVEQQQTGFFQANISTCCLGKTKTAYGYIWSFTELTKKEISDLTENLKRNKPVYQYDKNYQLVNIYRSASEIVQQTGFSCGNISLCCNGKRKTAYGYVWSYEPITKAS